MGKKAYQERLKQIRMDPVDADVYQQFSSSVQKQVSFETFIMTLIKFTKFFGGYFAIHAQNIGTSSKSNFEQFTSQRQRATMG